jgi:hypothetical protein
MPKLREIVSSENLSPSGFRVDPGAAAAAAGGQSRTFGRLLTQLGGQITEVVERRQATRIANSFAKAQAELSTELAEARRTADPNDPEQANFTENFMQRVDDRFAEMRESGLTRRGREQVDRNEANLRASLFQSASANQAAIANVKATEDLEDIQDAHVITLANDPTQFQNVIGQFDTFTDDLIEDGGLSTEAKLQARNAFNRDAALVAAGAWINRNVDTAEQLLDAGVYDDHIRGADKLKLQSAIAAKRKSQETALTAERDKQIDQFMIDLSLRKAAGEEVAETEVRNFHEEVGFQTTTQFQFALAASRGGKVASDQLTLLELETEVGTLTDDEMTAKVWRLTEAGTISGNDGRDFVKRNKSERETAETTPRKIMLSMVNTVIQTMPADLKLVGGGQALANAKADVELFIERNPAVSKADAIAEANRLLGVYVPLDFTNTAFAIGRPWKVTGNAPITEEMLDDATANLLEDRDLGRVPDDRQFREELKRLDRHRELLDMRRGSQQFLNGEQEAQ